ncbi:MAG TPA: NUDIX hydrolase [Candidatus Saccharimonadales bacterium]|nr:NUDIX hydrolase [Candidatus Saccharimonadales bacterium]
MITPWKRLKTEEVFHKYSLRVERWDFLLPDGREEDFYIRKSPDGACVLAITTDQKVITVKQFRPGPLEIFYELPGGMVEGGKSPEVAATAELLEESGYEGKVTYGGSYFEDAYTARKRHWCVVTDCRKVAEQKLEPNEFAEVVLWDIPDFIQLARSGQMTDAAAAMLALDHLKLL